jgi:hypothetical protein
MRQMVIRGASISSLSMAECLACSAPQATALASLAGFTNWHARLKTSYMLPNC